MVLMIMMIFDEHSDFSGAENGAGLSQEHFDDKDADPIDNESHD